MVEALVQYEYEAGEDDELSLAVGDVISNVVKQDGGWWEGELNGKRGVFPDNFVKEIKPEPKKKAVPMKEPPNRKPSGGGHVAELANKLGTKVGQKPAANNNATNVTKREAPLAPSRRARVTFSYAAENEDELSLEPGDNVEVLKQEEEGWWEGVVNGKTGMFPSNFVEIVEEEESEVPEKVIGGKKIRGVGLGNIFSEGPIKLRNTTKNPPKPSEAVPPTASKKPEPISHPTSQSNKPEHKAPQPKRPAPPVTPVSSEPPPVVKQQKPEMAKVLFAYKAENVDELNLTEGTVIRILDKDLEDVGWWKGECSGNVGVFPDNFVELLPQETTPDPEIEAKPRKPPPPDTPEHRPEHRHPLKPVELHGKAPGVGGIGGKKPGPPAPPPPSKKPQRPAEPRILPHNDGHVGHAGAAGLENEKEGIDVEATETLHHPTANRVKAPQRRPPSTVGPPAVGHPAVGPNRDLPEPPAVNRDTRRLPPTPLDTYPHTGTASGPTHPVLNHNVAQNKSNVSHENSVDNGSDIASDLSRLRQSSVTHTELEDTTDNLRTELRSAMHDMQLKFSAQLQSMEQDHNSRMDSMKESFEAQIQDLMEEIDQEKKIRLSTEVELERIRKLVSKH